MANHAKNLFVGVGGSDMINKSHMVGAVYGMERMMGKENTPVRKLFDYGLEHFLKDRPLLFALTVTTAPGGVIHTHGLFLGEGRDPEALLALAAHIRSAHPAMEIALYSGREEVEPAIWDAFDYVKVGPYRPECGPLNERTIVGHCRALCPARMARCVVRHPGLRRGHHLPFLAEGDRSEPVVAGPAPSSSKPRQMYAKPGFLHTTTSKTWQMYAKQGILHTSPTSRPCVPGASEPGAGSGKVYFTK